MKISQLINCDDCFGWLDNRRNKCLQVSWFIPVDDFLMKILLLIISADIGFCVKAWVQSVWHLKNSLMNGIARGLMREIEKAISW